MTTNLQTIVADLERAAELGRDGEAISAADILIDTLPALRAHLVVDTIRRGGAIATTTPEAFDDFDFGDAVTMFNCANADELRAHYAPILRELNADSSYASIQSTGGGLYAIVVDLPALGAYVMCTNTRDGELAWSHEAVSPWYCGVYLTDDTELQAGGIAADIVEALNTAINAFSETLQK